jgi:hypothetical protein
LNVMLVRRDPDCYRVCLATIILFFSFFYLLNLAKIEVGKELKVRKNQE